jgi:hypothetical protein
MRAAFVTGCVGNSVVRVTKKEGNNDMARRGGVPPKIICMYIRTYPTTRND